MKMSREDRVLAFELSMIPIMMGSWHLSVKELATLFKSYDILDYMDVALEMFNSTGTPGILEDLADYISIQGNSEYVNYHYIDNIGNRTSQQLITIDNISMYLTREIQKQYKIDTPEALLKLMKTETYRQLIDEQSTLWKERHQVILAMLTNEFSDEH